MQILRINGLTLTTTSTEKKGNYRNLFIYSQSVIFVFFIYPKCVTLPNVVYFRLKGHLKLLNYFSFFPISCFLPPKQ